MFCGGGTAGEPALSLALAEPVLASPASYGNERKRGGIGEGG